MTTNGNGSGLFERLTRPQQWTLLGGLMAVVLLVVLGAGWLLHSQGDAFTAAVKDLKTATEDGNRAIVAEQKQTREVLAGVLTEFKLEAQEHRHANDAQTRDRDRAVEALKEAIRTIPQLVVERIGATPRK